MHVAAISLAEAVSFLSISIFLQTDCLGEIINNFGNLLWTAAESYQCKHTAKASKCCPLQNRTGHKTKGLQLVLIWNKLELTHFYNPVCITFSSLPRTSNSLRD